MDARVGDRIIVQGHHTGEPIRDCHVVEVRGAEGSPPYVVRWENSGNETLFFPGSDAIVEHQGKSGH